MIFKTYYLALNKHTKQIYIGETSKTPKYNFRYALKHIYNTFNGETTNFKDLYDGFIYMSFDRDFNSLIEKVSELLLNGDVFPWILINMQDQYKNMIIRNVRQTLDYHQLVYFEQVPNFGYGLLIETI